MQEKKEEIKINGMSMLFPSWFFLEQVVALHLEQEDSPHLLNI